MIKFEMAKELLKYHHCVLDALRERQMHPMGKAFVIINRWSVYEKSEDFRSQTKAMPQHVFQVSGIGNPGIGPGRKNIARWLRKLRGQ